MIIFRKIGTLYKLLFNRASLYKNTPPGIIKQKLGDILPSNPIIIEAGAHTGQDTVFMKYLWPKSVIHAFEPVPNIFYELKKRTRKFKNVYCYQLALSDKTGTTEIFISEGLSDASSSLLKPKDHIHLFPEVKFNSSILVNITTIDSWAKENSVTHVDLLWLDMQGYELFALQKGTSILSSVKAIYMEVNLRETYENTPLYPEVKEWMAKNKFKVFHEDLEDYMGNVLFVKAL